MKNIKENKTLLRSTNQTFFISPCTHTYTNVHIYCGVKNALPFWGTHGCPKLTKRPNKTEISLNFSQP